MKSAYNNNPFKKVISWICTLCMILNMLPASAFATEPDAPADDVPQAVLEEVTSTEPAPDPVPDANAEIPQEIADAVPQESDPVDTESNDPVAAPADTDEADVSDNGSQEEPSEEPQADAVDVPDNMEAIEPDAEIVPDVPAGTDTPAEDTPALPSLFKDFPVNGTLTSDSSYAEYVYTASKDEILTLVVNNPDLVVEVCYFDDATPVDTAKSIDEENALVSYALSVMKDEVYLIRVSTENITEDIEYTVVLTSEEEQADAPADNTDSFLDIQPETADEGEPASETEDTDAPADILPSIGDTDDPQDNTAFENFLNDTQPVPEDSLEDSVSPVEQDEPDTLPADNTDNTEDLAPDQNMAEDVPSVTDDEPADTSDAPAIEINGEEEADIDLPEYTEEDASDEEQPATDGEENIVSDEDDASSTDETEDGEDSSVNTEEDEQEKQEADILKEDSDEDSEASEETEDNADKDSEEGNDESAETEDEDKSEETAEDDADLEIDEETLICEDGIYTYTGHGLTVSVETSEENELPEGSGFVLIPVSAEEPRVQEYVARVAEMHGVDPASVTPYVFDMHFEKNDAEVHIAKGSSVGVKIQFDEAIDLSDTIAAPFYHAENNDLIELIPDVTITEKPALRGAKIASKSFENVRSEDDKYVSSISFSTCSFSDFMIMGVRGTRSVDKYAILYSTNELVFQEGNTPDPSRGSVVGSWLCENGVSEREWASYSSSITGVYFYTTIAFNSPNLFDNFSNLTYIENINYADVTNLTSLARAFYRCQKLETVTGLRDWDVHTITNIQFIFNSCDKLSNITDVQYWTISPINMGSSFYFCRGSRSSLNLSNWDLSGVTNMAEAFQSSYFTSINFGSSLFTNLPSGQEINLSHTFENATYITSLNGFFENLPSDTPLILSYTFSYIKIPNINLSGKTIKYLNNTFEYCGSIISVDLSNCNFPYSSPQISKAFYNCRSLTTLNLSGITANSPALESASAFYNTESLEYLDLSSTLFNGTNKNVGFLQYSGITRITLGSGFVFSNAALPGGHWQNESTGDIYTATELKANWNSSMAGTYSLIDTIDEDYIYAILYENGDLVFQQGNELDPDKGPVYEMWSSTDGKFNPSQCWAPSPYTDMVTNIYINTPVSDSSEGTTSFFRQKKNLVAIYNINNFIVQNSSTLANCFANCPSLQTITGLEQWDVSTITSFQEMFYSCRSIERVDFGGNTTLSNVKTIGSMFRGCSSLEYVDLGNVFSSITGTASAETAFSGCSSLAYVNDIFVNIPDGVSISLANTFKDCSVLNVPVDLSDKTITSLSYAFSGCKLLPSVDLSGATLSGTATYAFNECNNLVSLDLSNITASSSASSLTYTFYNTTKLRYLDLSSTYFNGGSKASSTFSGCGITKVTLGSGFKFNSSTLPTGNWVRESTGDVYTAAQLKSAWNSSMADTYERKNIITFVTNVASISNLNIVKPVNTVITEDELPVIENDGYQFVGWFTTANGGTQLLPGDTVTQGSYYAHWTENSYTLILNRNLPDEINNDETSIALTYSQEYTLSSSLYSYDDNTILEWNTNKTGTGESYAASSTVSKLTAVNNETIYLYAIWGKDRNITITFHPEGGSDVEPLVAEKGTAITSQEIDRHVTYRDGYAFAGWWTDSDGGERWDGSDHIATASLDLYAHWDDNYCTVTFVPNGHWISHESMRVQKNAVFGSLKNFPTGNDPMMTLAGFFTEPTFGQGEKLTKYTRITQDVTYYAQWGYQPKFNFNGGSAKGYNANALNTDYPVCEDSVVTISVFPDAKKDGYTLKRWMLIDGTTVNPGDTVDLAIYPDIIAEWESVDTVHVYFHLANYTSGIMDYALAKDTPLNYYPYPSSTNTSFVGWYDENDTLYTIDTIISANLDLYPKYAGESMVTYKFIVPGNSYYAYDPRNSASSTLVNGNRVTPITRPRGDEFGTLPGLYVLSGGSLNGKYLKGWYSDPDPFNSDGTLKPDVEELLPTTAKEYNTEWYPYLQDNTEIKTYNNITYRAYAEWTSSSSKEVINENNTLMFCPASSTTSSLTLTSSLHAHFELNADVTDTLPIGAVRIIIPKYIWKDWNGNDTGSINISSQLPEYPKKRSGMSFSYKEDTEGNYHIFNNVPITGGAGIDFTVAYTANSLDIPGGALNNNTYEFLSGYPYYSNTVPVLFGISSHPLVRYTSSTGNKLYDPFDPDVLSDTTNLRVELHSKVMPKLEMADPNSISFENKYISDEDYFYITWTPRISWTTTQPFSYKITMDDLYDGVTFPNFTPYNQMQHVTTASSGHATSYVFKTRYPVSLLADIPSTGLQLQKQARAHIVWDSGYEEDLVVTATATIYGWKDTKGEFEKTRTNALTGNYYTLSGDHLTLIGAGLNKKISNITWSVHYEGTSSDSPVIWDSETNTYLKQTRVIALSDGINGDVMYSSQSSTAPYSWEPVSGNVVLKDDDYEINSISIRVSEYDSSCVDGTWLSPKLSERYYNMQDPYVYVRYRNSDNLVYWSRPHLPYNESSIGYYTVDITLPAGVVGYEVRYPTSFFKTFVEIYASFTIYGTDHLKPYILNDTANNCYSLFKNRGYCNIWTSDDPMTDPEGYENIRCALSNNRRAATDVFFHATNWLGGFYSASRSLYGLKPPTSNTLNARIATSTGSNIIVDANNGFQEGVIMVSAWNTGRLPITKGRFNILLPRGAIVDLSTLYGINTSANGNSSYNVTNYDSLFADTSRHLGKEYYNVERHDDWEGSGRTMLIIDYTASQEDNNLIMFQYKQRMTYDDIVANGTQAQSDVSFTDLSTSIPYKTKSGALTSITPDDVYYIDIDSMSESIAYSSVKTTYTAINAYTWGFTKTASTNEEYKQNTVTIPNGLYSYKVNYSQSETSSSSSLVFFDVLERGAYNDAFHDGALDTATEWEGVFDSIDLTPLTNLLHNTTTNVYCAPEVYYSTKAKDQFTSADWDVTNSATWSTTMPDKSLITAVAVDCSTASNGADFIMKGKKSATFYIRMRATTDMSKIEKEAVNQAMLKANVDDVPYEASDESSVLLKAVNLAIEKVASPASGTQEAPCLITAMDSLEYTLAVSNNNCPVSIPNVIVEDELSTHLTVQADKIKVHFGNPANAMSLSASPRASMRATGNTYTFTINYIDPGETCYIVIPTVAKADYGQEADNIAVITSYNGIEEEIESNTTYHKILRESIFKKLSNLGAPVVGATLQIWKTDGLTEELVHEWVSDNSNHKLVLDEGAYVLKESTVPSGYEGAADIPFEVEADGILQFADTTTGDTIIMIDEAIVHVHGTKSWKYDAPEDRPASITIRLMRKIESDADFAYTGISQVVTANDDWEYDFGNLPRYDLNGYEYTYSIEETTVTGYTAQYVSGSPDANGLQITFNARTSTYDSSDKFTLYYRFGDKYFGRTYYGTNSASTNPAGATIQIPSNEFWIAFETDNANNDYGFKLDQITPVQMDASSPALERINLPAWVSSAAVTEYTGGRYPETEHNYFIYEQTLMHYTRTMDGESYDVINIKDSIGFNIPINKVNEDNEKIGGVSLRLTSDPQPGDPEIEPIEWVTEAGETHYVHLYPGHYVLHEVSAVTGYLLADDIAFEVNGQGKIIIDNTELNTLEMLDRYSSQPYPIKKVWMDESFESRRPASLTFELVRKSDNTVVGTKTLTAEDAASSTIWEGEFDPVPVVDNSNNPIEYYVRETNTLTDYVKVYGLEHVNGFNVTFTADSDIGDGRLYIVLLDSTQETPLEDLQMEGHLTLNPLYGMAYLEGDDMAGNTYYVPNRADLNAIGFYVEWPDGTTTGSLGIASIVPTEETHSYTLSTSSLPYPTDWSDLQNVTMNSTYPNLTTRQTALGNNVSAGVWHFDMYQSEDDFDGSAVVNMIRSDITHEYPVTFSKVKPDNTMLAGAHLKLYTSEETLVSEWDTSASEAHTEDLEPGDYVLKETGVPTGYLKAADIAFTVANDGTILVNSTSVQSVSMTDASQPTIAVDKVDYSHQTTSLSGAVLNLYNSSNTLLLTWTSSGTSQDITSYVRPGQNYRIHESHSPNGYNIMSEDIYIQIANDGTVTMTTTEWASLTGSAANGFVLKLYNNAGVVFPATGASDRTWVYLGAVLIMVATAALFIKRKRRQKA